jgi:hypothetical protein
LTKSQQFGNMRPMVSSVAFKKVRAPRMNVGARGHKGAG